MWKHNFVRKQKKISLLLYHVMNTVHINVLLVLVSKLLIPNKQNNNKLKNLIAYTALFAGASSAV